MARAVLRDPERAGRAALQPLNVIRPKRPVEASVPSGLSFEEQVAAFGDGPRLVTPVLGRETGFAVALAGTQGEVARVRWREVPNSRNPNRPAYVKGRHFSPGDVGILVRFPARATMAEHNGFVFRLKPSLFLE